MSRAVVALSILLCLVSAAAFGALDTPSSIAREATSAAGAVVTFTVSVVDGNDGSDGRPADTVTCSPASGSLFPIGTTTVFCSGSEGSTGSFPVTVSDHTPPELSLPRDFAVVTTNTSGETVTYTATARDLVDGNVAVVCTPPSGSTFPIGTTSVTCTASDSRGNTATDGFNITVATSTPPPGNPDIVAEATGPDGARVSFNIGGGEDEDGRPNSGGCSPASGSQFPLGETTVVCPSGNFIVSVVDTTGPSLELPEGVSATATSASGAQVTYTAAATDLVDGSVGINCTPPSGSTFAIGTTTVNCSATDSRGNTNTGTFEVVVAAGDIPFDITVEATGPGGAMVTFTFTGCNPPSGSLFPLGATLVACTHGNFTLTVVDTTPPTLTLPADITAEATSASGAVVTYTATATDIVDVTVPVVCEPPGSTFAIGTTQVSCTATDSSGNSAGGSFTITVADTTPPDILSVSVNPSTIWPPNKKMVDVVVTAQVQDAVDAAPIVRIYSITCDETIAANDTAITGALTAQLRADRDAKLDGRVYTLHIEAIDAYGNRSTATVTVTVPHDESGNITITPPTKRRSVGGK